MREESIAAIATAQGEGAIAIVRLSGRDVLQKASPCLSEVDFATLEPRKIYRGTLINEQRECIDQVLFFFMRAPHSYTGEDCVEIHCHGGILVTQRVLERILQTGVRTALPGEFTFRAFMNGKIDLSQAEAVEACIQAKNNKALACAQRQLAGKLSYQISSFQKELNQIAALFEAWVDFPEEELELLPLSECREQLHFTLQKMERLCRTFEYGRKVREGISICLTGAPNVGKSSLMNLLLRRERAIVTPLPGTTRDLLEEEITLLGWHVRLIDSAGIHPSTDPIEREGIERAKRAREEADLVLLILDASRELSSEEWNWIERLPIDRTIALWNKSDLLPFPDSHSYPTLPFSSTLSFSVHKEWGLHSLFDQISRFLKKGVSELSSEELLLTHLRHREALERSCLACRNVLEGLNRELSPECLALEMREALLSLAEIIGTDVGEDLLSTLFSSFCVGK